jgi:uncharacterized protein (TIGR03546 family)
MKFLKSAWNSFRSTVKGFDTPRQLALGIVLGMIIGLIPKDSLLPYAIGVFALLTSANILCIAVGAIIFTWISPMLDSVSHQIGVWVLTFEPLESTWSTLFQLPVVPWIRFENTVVMGSLCLGLLLAIPIYFISYYCFAQFGSAIYQYFSKTRVAGWLVGNTATHLQKS